MILGIALGIPIGLVTGLVALLLLMTAISNRGLDVKSVLAITAELLAIPTFWFGGPWVTSRVLEDVDWSAMLNGYLPAVAVVFCGFLVVPTWTLSMTLARKVGGSS
ncbi:MAG: hypothetical protein AAGG07_14325 [Planctomycetota bacterium]